MIPELSPTGYSAFAGGGAGADSCKDRGSRKPLVAQSYELFRVSAPWRKQGCRTCTSGSDYGGERLLLPFLKMFSRLMTPFLESTHGSLLDAEISKDRWVSEKLASRKFGGASWKFGGVPFFVCVFRGTGKTHPESRPRHWSPLAPPPSPQPQSSASEGRGLCQTQLGNSSTSYMASWWFAPQ